jgi:uncharacterized coiled-coil protein SlyX
MDENQIYNEERDEGGNEPMTLEEAFAMAQNRLGENASETPAEAVETSSVSESTNTTETPENTPTSPTEPHSETETIPATSSSEIETLKAQLAQQNEMLARYQAQLQATQTEMQNLQSQASAANRSDAEVVAESLLEPPVIDFSAIMYESKEVQDEAQRKWLEDAASFLEQKLSKKYAPIEADYQRREAEIQRTNAKERFKQNPQYKGFAEREAWMERILDKTGLRDKLPLDDQYRIAYLMTQGVDAVRARENPTPPPATPSVDKRLEAALADDELMRAIEARRIRDLQNRSTETPPAMNAGGGTNRIGLNVPEEATDFATARQRSLARLLGKK